jgi:glycerate 2-kinase
MGKIKNFGALAQNDLRGFALLIAEAGFKAIDTKEVIRRQVRIEGGMIFVGGEGFRLEDLGRIVFVGIGKCSFDAGAAVEEVLGDKLAAGVLLDVRAGSLKKIKVLVGTHPMPSEQNIAATREIVEFLKGLTEKDLVIFVISGGGSALLCLPDGFSLAEELLVEKHLMKAGADIYEMNTIRKHLSLARGGNLAKAAWPARVVSLIFSDVIGDNIEFIASGPTVKDITMVTEAREVYKKYNIEVITGFPPDKFLETPTEDKYFEKVRNIVVVSNAVALDAMQRQAAALGLASEVVTRKLSGEARSVGVEIQKTLDLTKGRKVLLYGGETTVQIKGKGKGGRNLELALSALRFVGEDQIIISLASDGRDNTDYAGGICDVLTRRRAEKLGLDIEKYLADDDSFGFFSKVGDYVMTGPTESNVADLIIAIHG